MIDKVPEEDFSSNDTADNGIIASYTRKMRENCVGESISKQLDSVWGGPVCVGSQCKVLSHEQL